MDLHKQFEKETGMKAGYLSGINSYCDEYVEWLEAQNRELVDAANKLIHLHSCEQEGLSSGQPTPEQWMKAVEKLSTLTQGEAK